MPDSVLSALFFLVPPLALVLDRLFGEPPVSWHPVCHMGKMADCLEKRARTGFKGKGHAWHLAAGCVSLLLLLLSFCLPAGLFALLFDAAHPALGSLAAAIVLWLCISPRSMEEYARAVQRPLARGDLLEARLMLSRIVGRETQDLDEKGIARAAVESVAENSTDGTVASLFWAAVGLAIGGAPAACALVVAHRVANTMDAMWGKKDEKYLYFGRCAARLDDVMACLPARIVLPMTALACLFVKGTNARDAWRIGRRYCRQHESPNSAFSEAAFAGALGLTLGGPCRYQGRLVEHAPLGEGRREVNAEDIGRALALMKTLCRLCALLAGLCAALFTAL